MKVLILLLLTLPLITSCYNPSPDDVMSDLLVINGNWKSYKGVKFNENWRFVNQNHFEGEGFSINSTDTTFFELLKIERKDDSIYYGISMSRHGKYINFKLTKPSKNSWEFINPDNNYPSIITLSIEDDSLLTIATSNIRKHKKQFFYLKKVTP